MNNYNNYTYNSSIFFKENSVFIFLCRFIFAVKGVILWNIYETMHTFLVLIFLFNKRALMTVVYFINLRENKSSFHIHFKTFSKMTISLPVSSFFLL